MDAMIRLVVERTGVADVSDLNGKIGQHFKDGSSFEVWQWYIILCSFTLLQLLTFVYIYVNTRPSWCVERDSEGKLKASKED